MANSLAPVIGVVNEKCVNCHMCISVCPVKYCIDGSGDHVEINHELCIGCGSCIAACTHEARVWLDDADAFFEALAKKEKIVAIVAPAVVSSFPDRYLNLNGYLKAAGVDACFDVSFGAELTVHSYLSANPEESKSTIIAQPCPAIVTYIETYHPELIQYLAPFDSPMVHTMKMIREFYPQYANHRIAAISPCVAKRREFDETGLGDFNVTFRSIAKHLNELEVELNQFPSAEYDGPLSERAVSFSTPGGLLRTVERTHVALARATRRVEGPGVIYDYLEKFADTVKAGFSPPLVDCLNCSAGCNGGPGTLTANKSIDEVETSVEDRAARHRRNTSNGP